VDTAGDLGTLSHADWHGSIPLYAMACDQQAALAGHGAFAAGAIKATYGTGVFVLANAGARRDAVPDVETSIAWTLPDGSTDAVLQGGVFTAGAFVDWLRDGLGVIGAAGDTEELANSVSDTAGVRVLPALVGLGSPWWRPETRAVVAGLTLAATRAHVARATLDGIAHRVADVVEAMAPSLPAVEDAIRVDGGLTANRYLMERQADLLGISVDVATAEESTALGVAALAGIGAGLLGRDEIRNANPVRERLRPRLSAADRKAEREAWRRFVATASNL
jgi:glycerol kinase